MDNRHILAAADPFAIRPFLVFWELTRACALACSHCRATAQHHRDPSELTTREALDLVDELADLAPPMLILTGGDPMIRSIGLLTAEERQAKIEGPCGDCRWFALCGGGFRTRAAAVNGHMWGSDPGCYLSRSETAREKLAAV
jgi:MoaA/NifB/PqqE/SkfB family radical SAM enzyme